MTQTSAVSAPVTPTWQNPYVEVIRYGFAHHNVGWQQHGDVEQATDRQIQKNVFKVRGTIAATNYVRFPREVSKTNQGLGLTGRYVYLQLRRARGQQVTLHLDFLTAKKSALRFSMSSMYTSLRSSGSVLRIPLDVGEVWTTIVVDMAGVLQLHGFNGYSRETYRYLKAVTCCASMNLRNVFASSTYYTPETLPSNLALPTAHENQFGPFGWMELLSTLGVRNATHDDRKKQPGTEDGSKYVDFSAASRNGDDMDEDGDDDDDGFASETFAAVSPMPGSPPLAASHAHAATSVDTSGTGGPPLSPTSRAAGLIRDREDVLSRADQIMRDAGFSVPSPRRRMQDPRRSDERSVATSNQGPISSAAMNREVLSPRRYLASEHSDWPDPILSLTRVIGFSAAFPTALRWVPDAPTCVYTSYSTIILREFTADAGGRAKRDFPSLLSHAQHQDVVTQSAWATQSSTMADAGEALTDDREVFLTGHTGEICALDVSPDGAFLASAQNTPQCVLRMWDLRRGSNECAIVMKAPTRSIHALAFSKDAAAFCVVGMDDRARTQIFVWDSSSLLASPTASVGAVKKLVLRARQTCDFPIHAIAFSPYEPGQLVSCGKENVRFWRIHEARHHLPGTPVILKEYSRGTVFTDIAFDGVYPQFPSNLPRVRPVYVSSSVGSILVVNYDTREVACVYKLHDSAINSICVNEGFCVTGSDDKFLRVWPLDFSDFFLEAEHEAPVKSVDVSSDGMRVAVGTSNGAIGVLHLADQRYRTVLRSHTHPVSTLAPLPGDALVTSAPDGTLRVWDTMMGTQTMEFDVSKDPVTCVTAMPTAPSGEQLELTIAVGFQSGCTRIFALGKSSDVATESTAIEPRVLHEFQQHQSELCDVLYKSDGKTLYTSATGQQLCMYDVAQGYAPVKMFIADMDTGHGKMCLSRDRRFLAVLQQGRRSVLLLDAVSLCTIRVLTPPKPTHMTASDSQGDMQELTQLVISWNSQELLTVTRGDRLHVFSLAETPSGPLAASVPFGGVIHSMPLLGQHGISSLAVSPNLKYLATGGSDSSVRVWQCEFGKHKFQRMNQTFRLHAGQGTVRGLVFSNDGRRLIATSDSSSAAFVWRFRGNVSKLPALELQFNSADASRHGSHGHKAEFELPLEDISNKKEVKSAPVTPEVESPNVVDTGELKLSTSSVSISWKRLVPAKTDTGTRHVVWASPLGCLISTSDCGHVIVVEMLESGQQYYLHPASGADRIMVSPSQGMLAVLSPNPEFVEVYNLEALRQESNQAEGDEASDSHDSIESTRIRVSLGHRFEKVWAVEFSVDSDLLCISGEASRQPVFFVFGIRSGGELLWRVNVTSSTPITSILSQSPREFVCASTDARQPLQRLRVPPFSLSAAALTLEPMETSLPTQPQRFSFRDDGAALAVDEGRGGCQQRCRFAVAVDSDAYCYFLDLERQHKLHTMQLLLPSARSKITAIQWVGASEWQALVATLDDDTIAVFVLPTQFAFTSTKMRVAAMDWTQLKRTGRLTSALSMSFEGQRIAQVLADPLSEVGVVATQDGASAVVNFRTGQRRVLHAAPTLQVSGKQGMTPQLALEDSVLVTLSGDRHALQCWEPAIGRELARLHVASTLCACFAVSGFDSHLVAAGYEDGSFRVFDVKEQQLVAQCVLPPASQRIRPPSGGKSREASSPSEALSSLKQKQATKRSALRSPAPNRMHDQGFRELHFIGPRCILAVVGGSRVVLFDLSDLALTSESTAIVAGVGSTSQSKQNRRQVKTIHYRDLHLPAPDRMKGTTKTQRSALQAGSSGAGWDTEIVSVDTQLLCSRSSAKSQRRHADVGAGEGALSSTRAFMITARLTDRGRGTSAVVAHVFAGNEVPAGHPVHAEEDAAPCDSWVIPAHGLPLFHPSNSREVVYATEDEEGRQWIESRDFHAHAATLRLAVPAATFGSVPAASCSLMRWNTPGKSTVALIDTATSSRPRVLGVADLARRSLVRVEHDGGVVLPLSHGTRSGPKPLLVAVPTLGTRTDDGFARLVVAELAHARHNAPTQ